MEHVRPVTVQFLKYPDHLHWGFETRWLGEDEYGTWVFAPQGSKRWKGTEPFRPVDFPAVFCAPHDGWWHLHYNGNVTLPGGEPIDITHFIDITTKPTWMTRDRYEMVDLDLDVLVTSEGEIRIDDEDEFAVHQVVYGYSQDMIARALAETRLIVSALEQNAEPFFEVAEAWLNRARAG
jgi:uncharacterized protein